MSSQNGSAVVMEDKDVLIERTFNASPEKLFAAWTDPQQLLQWYAPHGCTIAFNKLEAKPQGEFLSCIRIPSGEDCWCKGTYLEFDPPRSLVFSMINCDEQGNTLDASSAGKDSEWPTETIVTVTFEAVGTGTRLTLHQTVSQALATRTGAYPSWLQMLDRLDELTTH